MCECGAVATWSVADHTEARRAKGRWARQMVGSWCGMCFAGRLGRLLGPVVAAQRMADAPRRLVAPKVVTPKVEELHSSPVSELARLVRVVPRKTS